MKSTTVTIALLLLSACADEGEGGASAPGAGAGDGTCEVRPPSSCDGLEPIPVEEACTARLQAGCDAGRRCFRYTEAERLRCRENVVRLCAASAFPAAVAAGSLTYDPAAAACCVRRLANDFVCLGSGQLFLGTEESCARAFVGELEAGAPCRIDLECASGICDAEESCPGRCAGPFVEGGPCYHVECGGTLSCVLVEDGSLACTAPRQRGQDCLDARDCVNGLACGSDGASSGTTCRPPTCTGESCARSMACDFLTHDCDDDTETCVPLLGPGGRCFSQYDCEAGLRCAHAEGASPLDGTCVAGPTDGEACQQDGHDCGMLRTCLPDGTCGFSPILGEACDRPSQNCVEGYCAPDGRCSPHRAPGEPCADDREACAGRCGQDDLCEQACVTYL